MAIPHRTARIAVLITLVTCASLSAGAQEPTTRPASTEAKVSTVASPVWVLKSNRNADLLTKTTARFVPEFAGQLGAEGVDTQIIDLKPGLSQRGRKATAETITVLEGRLAREKDPPVRQDLQILLKASRDNLRENELEEKYQIPYFNMSRLVFTGLRQLLDDQVEPERRKAALVRLKRYAGLEQGYTPITVLATDRSRERFNQSGIKGPSKIEVEKDLGTSQFFVNGIEELFKKYQIDGYQEAYGKLKQQLTAYNGFVRKEILPKARADFRLPPEVYAFNLQQVGVDIPPAELTKLAHAAFEDIQQQMQVVAQQVAKDKGYTVTDYRDVIRELKKEQLTGDAILPHYQKRLAEIEGIIRRENLVTLPERPARIRLASAAESAQQPAPNMRPPRLLGNTGEQGEFVLPLNVPPPAGAKPGTTERVDDFTYTAASWTLTAHEARPGHELQFASLIENGVSTARAIYAFNSTNVEGWGLYSEYIMLPFMPAEGKLVSLQLRLLRAARAFLDPELQIGKVTPAQAMEVLTREVALSAPFANQEVERYTFRAPGQATSYFYGYTRLVQLRADVEQALGARFDQKAFHDFILAQGLLPPDLLREAVMKDFVARQKVASR